MGAGIPDSFAVDFSLYRTRDLVQQAIDRLLGQHYDKCTLKQFVLAVMGEVQCLYEALIDVQEQRTLYKAEGETLSAIGRIVGEPRLAWQYDETSWMTADRPLQGPDAVTVWSLYGSSGKFVPAPDAEYKYSILWRIAKNHTLCASVPELLHLIRMITDTEVSFEKTGPMQASILVPPDLPSTAWRLLTQAKSDKRCDDAFMLPYPATFWFYTTLTFYPPRPENLNWFCADRDNRQRCDRAPCAVGVPLPDQDPGNFTQPDPDASGTATIYLPENWLCADRNNEQRPDQALCAAGVPYRRM